MDGLLVRVSVIGILSISKDSLNPEWNWGYK